MPAGVVKFGDGLELDRNAYELRRAGRPLKLERIPLDVLLLLVERRGGLVSREDIVAKIWGKDVFLDTDNSINSAIRKIRQVLKDDPENPIFVQTVTGKGYRFIATVTENGVPGTQQNGAGKLAVSAQSIKSKPVISQDRLEEPRRAGGVRRIGATAVHTLFMEVEMDGPVGLVGFTSARRSLCDARSGALKLRRWARPSDAGSATLRQP